MDCQKDCCQACSRATAAAAEPTGQVVVYWAWKSALRCTNAVAPGATRLTAPPSASNAMPPDAPGAPPARWNFSTPASRVPIPWLFSGLVEKLGLGYSEARAGFPARLWGGMCDWATVPGPAGGARLDQPCVQPGRGLHDGRRRMRARRGVQLLQLGGGGADAA